MKRVSLQARHSKYPAAGTCNCPKDKNFRKESGRTFLQKGHSPSPSPKTLIILNDPSKLRWTGGASTYSKRNNFRPFICDKSAYPYQAKMLKGLMSKRCLDDLPGPGGNQSFSMSDSFIAGNISHNERRRIAELTALIFEYVGWKTKVFLFEKNSQGKSPYWVLNLYNPLPPIEWGPEIDTGTFSIW
jgi:hypothetical protein